MHKNVKHQHRFDRSNGQRGDNNPAAQVDACERYSCTCEREQPQPVQDVPAITDMLVLLVALCLCYFVIWFVAHCICIFFIAEDNIIELNKTEETKISK